MQGIFPKDRSEEVKAYGSAKRCITRNDGTYKENKFLLAVRDFEEEGELELSTLLYSANTQELFSAATGSHVNSVEQATYLAFRTGNTLAVGGRSWRI